MTIHKVEMALSDIYSARGWRVSRRSRKVEKYSRHSDFTSKPLPPILSSPLSASSAAPGQSHFTGEFSNELPISHSSPSIMRLEAAAPHYHDNQLQVKVFWKSRREGKWAARVR